MKDNTLIALVIGGAALWYFTKGKSGLEGKNTGPLQTPVASGGGLKLPVASSTVLGLPQNNNQYASYITAGADLVRAVGDFWGNYKGSTSGAAIYPSKTTGPGGETFYAHEGRDGTYFSANKN